MSVHRCYDTLDLAVLIDTIGNLEGLSGLDWYVTTSEDASELIYQTETESGGLVELAETDEEERSRSWHAVLWEIEQDGASMTEKAAAFGVDPAAAFWSLGALLVDRFPALVNRDFPRRVGWPSVRPVKA